MTLTFPASLLLIAAMNPCPCGFANDFRRECFCTPPQIQRYMSKISGPLMDRIDIQVDVPAVPYKDLAGPRQSESSETIRHRVIAARNTQLRRFFDEHIYSKTLRTSKHRRRAKSPPAQLYVGSVDGARVRVGGLGVSAMPLSDANSGSHRGSRCGPQDSRLPRPALAAPSSGSGPLQPTTHTHRILTANRPPSPKCPQRIHCFETP